MSVEIYSSGVLVSSGALIADATIGKHNSMTITNGGTANNTIVDYLGVVYISSGGIANSTIVNSGWVHINNGGIANHTNLDNGRVDIYAGGTANYTSLTGWGGILDIYGGGIANSTIIEAGGHMRVFSGGNASSIDIQSGAILEIESGGTATEVIWTPCIGNISVQDGAYVTFVSSYSGVYYCINSDELEDTVSIFNDSSCWEMCIMTGGTATNIVCNSAVVYSGGIAIDTLLEGNEYSYAVMDIYSGGKAENTSVESNGEINIHNGGVASQVTIKSNTSLYIHNGGSATGIDIKSGGSLTVESGGTATDVIWTPIEGNITSAIGAYVTYANKLSGIYYGSNGEVLSHTQTMNDMLLSGTSNTEVTDLNAYMYVMSDGCANNININSMGVMYIYEGGIASDTTVDYCGEMSVLSGGYAESTTISGYDQSYECGSMNIHSGGSAYDINVTSGGRLRIYSGGSAVNIDAEDGAYLMMDIASNTYLTGTYAGEYFYMTTAYLYNFSGSGHFFVYDEARVDDFYLSSGSYIDVYSGGSATNIRTRGHIMCSGGVVNSCFVEKYGQIDVYQGGVAKNITLEGLGAGLWVSDNDSLGENTLIYESACLSIVNGATGNNNSAYGHYQVLNKSIATNTIVYNRGNMTVDDSLASKTEIYSGGSMAVFNSGTAISTTIQSGGVMNVSMGGVANSTTVAGGRMYISSGGVANSTTINGVMRISSGGVANSTTVNSGRLDIEFGGVANSTTVNSGLMLITSGGVANCTTVNAGRLEIVSGGVANCTTVNSSGCIMVYRGGSVTALTLSAGGLLGGYSFAEDKYWENITNGSAIIADNVYILGYNMHISSGGVANCTTMRGGLMHISSGGVANCTTMRGGLMHISSGGVANNTTVKRDMHIFTGGMHQGYLEIYEGAIISAYQGSIIDFTVAERTTADGYLINDLSLITGTPTYTITVSADQAFGTYKLAQGAENFTGSISIGDETNNYGTITVNGDALFFEDTKYTLTQTAGNLTLTVAQAHIPQNLVGSSDGVSWDEVEGAQSYQVEFSVDKFETALSINTANTSVDTYNLPQKDYLWHVKTDTGNWSRIQTLAGTANTGKPQLIYSNNDGDIDLFFVRSSGKWGAGYAAEHQGRAGVWRGTCELAVLTGKNKLEDVFIGSNDANILVMTDDANGDALFVDDVYSAFPDEIAAQSRIAQINEIRAGAGDDIVDLTSQQFVYIGDGVTVYGGLGNDVIWANSGENQLFGDAGNDRIVGGSDNDIIVGGAGNDRMHGGGGSDTFCFGSDWGIDTVEQIAGGSVTLWFESGSEDFWNAETLTYSDGTNRVKVSGVSADAVTLKFGDVETAIAGAFDSFSSEKIFEDQEKALLA